MFSQIYQGGPPEDPDEKMEAVLMPCPQRPPKVLLGQTLRQESLVPRHLKYAHFTKHF